MQANRLGGLVLGLLAALLTAGIAAGSTGVTPPAAVTIPLPSATPVAVAPTPASTATAALPPTATPTQPAPTDRPPSTPTPTRVRLWPPSPTPSPTATPAMPTPLFGEVAVPGFSVQSRAITAHRFGHGPIKVALVGDIHGEYEANTHELAQLLLAHFQAHPGQVPPEVSLWIIPTMNPDGLATGHRWNANNVDLNRNADTDLDGCAGNDWSPDTVGHEGDHPGAGGAYPFSEPEARAIRDFLDDAWIAVFYHSAAEAIFVDSCKHHAPTAHLAQVLSEATGYPVPAEGWTGYPVTGDFGDYLAGEGVAAVTLELTDHDDPEFERNLAGVRAILAHVSEIVSEEADESGAEFVWLATAMDVQQAGLPRPASGGVGTASALGETNTGVWQYADNTFIHPIALEVVGSTAYLLDGGRVLAQNLDQPDAPTMLLAPGETVQDVRVLEPLDLAADEDDLLVLDRAGDVYRYDPASGAWTVERYGRPPGSTSDHYFVALASDGVANYLLGTTHEQVIRSTDGQKDAVWVKLPRSRDVDVSAAGGGVYVLTRGMNNPKGNLLRYRDGKQAAGFASGTDLMHPRQVVATDAAVYVLDRAGRRLLKLDPASGALLTLYQFPDRREVSAIWADPAGERLLLAGRDTLYFYGEPEQSAWIEGEPTLTGPQPHDPALLESLRGYSVPIEGARVTNREFQMPGAPRHYRLGVHEGMDWYSGTVGVTVNRTTPVRAVADGVVIRALVDYQPLTAAQADEWYNQCIRQGYTPPDVLDGYRGRQVWIDHGNGVVSRYAHLSAIESGIVEGAEVKQGQVIATVGNSGTPASISSQTVEVHLHLELWVGDHFVGQFLRPIEAREWLEKILR